jgi:hypothetical protein
MILVMSPTPEVRMNRFLIPAALCLVLIVGSAGSAVAGEAAPAAGDTIAGALAPLGIEHDGLRATFGVVLRRGTAPAATRVERLALVRFLRSTLIPHAQAEELVLYPALESVLGTRGYATATMVHDHRAIAGLTLDLSLLVDSDTAAFERKAVALAALVDHHFANEEDFVLPNLAAKMSDAALRGLLARMDAQRVMP